MHIQVIDNFPELHKVLGEGEAHYIEVLLEDGTTGKKLIEIFRKIIKIRAESLGVVENEDPKITLHDIETIYKDEAADFFLLSRDTDWNPIVKKYYESIENKRLELSPEDFRLWLSNEIRRYMLAKYLQLNKFTATEEEILIQLRNLGVSES